MMILPYLHFFSTLVYLYLAVYALIRNPKALTNRIFAFIVFIFALWAFSLIFLHNPYSSLATAVFFASFCSIAWAGFSSFLVLFSLAFTGRTDILKKIWIYIPLFGVPLLFIYKQWTNGLLVDYIHMDYGWKPQFAHSLWPHLFYLYFMIYMGVGLYFYVDFIRKTGNATKKKQARIMLISISITLVLGSLTDVFLPLLNIHSIPNMAASFMLIWAIGVSYAIAKYKFLKITPVTASENILATMFDCLILIDMKGSILMVNEATTQTLGYEAMELKRKPITCLIKGEEDASHLVKTLLNPEGNQSPEFIFVTREGVEIPVLFSCSTLMGENGVAGGVVCVARDITERKKYEEERLRHHKLESLGLLAGGIAHDFNNLLAVIIGNIELAKELMPPGKNCDSLENAEQVAEVAAELTGKFITFSMGGWIKKEKISVAAFLNNLDLPLTVHPSSALDPETVSKFTFTTSYAPDVRGIDGDEAQLRQVLQSLLINAVESIPPLRKGIISVHAENSPEMELKNLPITLKTNSYVKIAVQDNGAGIAKQYLEKIFEPYFSTKHLSTQKGIGLGLTICMSIIKKHEGYITVASEKGIGTTVTLYLPAFLDE